MNRNVESHFAKNPVSIDMQRSTFDRSAGLKTSFNVGQLVPILLEEVLPGDTFKVTSSKVVRLQTLLKPIMDNLYLDTYYFFVPNRLVWEHWKQFMGENTESAWLPTTTYEVPQMAAGAPEANNKRYFEQYSVADYFGLPVQRIDADVSSSEADPTYGITVNALPFRAYQLIWNEFFRDQNLQDPVNIYNGDSTRVMGLMTNGSTLDERSPVLRPVARYHDYFSSALPSPQKGPDVSLPVFLNTDSSVPVLATKDVYTSGSPYAMFGDLYIGSSNTQVSLRNVDSTLPTSGTPKGLSSYVANAPTQAGFRPSNLWAQLDPNGLGVYATINQLRLAFQIQKLYEKDARGGTRYIEVIKSHFGVTSPDARLQRPEYLGGNRVPISIHEVTNTSEGTTEFLGNLGAKSHTSDVHQDFVHSFTEHGLLIGVCCVRGDHSFSQGINKMWSRKERLDYYFPVLANIGEQPIYTKELAVGSIYYDSQTQKSYYPDNTVFGYQEAWAEYRYKESRNTAEMRPEVSNSLASWHLGDYYSGFPFLSDSWIQEPKSNLDRCLAVTSANANQIFGDFYFKNIVTRPMPVYSIPGLIDHH